MIDEKLNKRIDDFWSDSHLQTLVVAEGLIRDMEEQLKQEKLKVKILNEAIIYGFYEDQYPIYSSKEDAHSELSSSMTVEEANGLVETIKMQQAAIDQLKDKCDKQANILRKAFPEKSGQYFICGEAGEQDEMGLPDYIHVCPAYGLDGMATYKKHKDYSAPGW